MGVDRTCEVEGCDRPHHARGLCVRHYARTRERNRHRVRNDRVLALRARNRAVSRLVHEFRLRFEELLAEARVEVTDENDALRAIAEAEGVIVTDDRQVWRLRSGPVADDDLADRVTGTEPGCTRCRAHHEQGHRCTECGTPVPPVELVRTA